MRKEQRVDWSEIEAIFPRVEKPSRYIDNEWNSIHKSPEETEVRLALIYPDSYEVGQSNVGLQIIYEILNNERGVAAERAFAPWPDFEEELRKRGIPLFSLESNLFLKNFDVLGFSLQYELTYTNVLNILDLAQVPLYSHKRCAEDPLIIGGGSCCFNPEPLAPFFDVFVVGDGEEVILELVNRLRRAKKESRNKKNYNKKRFLLSLLSLPGIYVPSFYEVDYDQEGKISGIISREKEAPSKVTKAVIADLNKAKVVTKAIVPYKEMIHDRYSLEIMRGCTRGCRFCQAGMIYRPVRERSGEFLENHARECLLHTGYEEISLMSLSSTDYSQIKELLSKVVDTNDKNLSNCSASPNIGNTSVSLPSLRADAFSLELAAEIQKVKRTGLTFAPEVGSKRLGRVINKDIGREDILRAASFAFLMEWNRLKLYFMIGLPTEEEEDLRAIVSLVHEVLQLGLKEFSGKGRRGEGRYGKKLKITISIAPFVPKPHTPFQWVAQDRLEEIDRKQKFLQRHCRGRHFNLRWHDSSQSIVEGVLARGDRRLASAIERAWQLGAKFDAWSDFFDFSLWQEAFEENNISLDWYAYRKRDFKEILPWDHIESGISKDFLKEEYEKAFEGKETGDCRWDLCSDCGVCSHLEVKNILYNSSANPQEKISKEASCFSQSSRDCLPDIIHPSLFKYRIKFTKTGRLRFLSHLELMKTMRRALRRASLPLAYSGIYQPKPKISSSPPLPVGVSSESEYLDVVLKRPLSSQKVVSSLNQSLPEELKVLEVRSVSVSSPSLMSEMKVGLYEVEVILDESQDKKGIETYIKEFQKQEKIIFNQGNRKKIVPQRLAVFSFQISQIIKNKIIFTLLVRVGDEYSLRPELIVSLMLKQQRIKHRLGRVHRCELKSSRDKRGKNLFN